MDRRLLLREHLDEFDLCGPMIGVDGSLARRQDDAVELRTRQAGPEPARHQHPSHQTCGGEEHRALLNPR